MTSFVALLRGINVGGHAKVPMAALRESFAQLGYPHARTFIQSGNVVFDSEVSDTAALAADIRARISTDFGLDVVVMLRTKAELDEILTHNPFEGPEFDPAKLAVTFLSTPISEELSSSLAIPQGMPEQVVSRGNALLIYYPDGMGKSKLDRSSFWKPLKHLDTTTRNWRSVGKIRDMMTA